MAILTITSDDGTEELVRVKLGPLEPSTAAITVLNALAGMTLQNKKVVPAQGERHVFELCGVEYLEPENR